MMFPLEDLRLVIYEHIEKPLYNSLERTRTSIVDKLDSLERAVLEAADRIINYLKPRFATFGSKSGIIIYPNDYYEIRFSPLGDYSAIVLTVAASYDIDATNGVEVRWFYSPDDDTYETLDDIIEKGQYTRLSFASGEKRVRTIVIPAITNYVLVQIVNLDSSCPVLIDMWYHYALWYSWPK